MARIAKSLIAPEQGYAHRDHRSKKGRKNVNRKARILLKSKIARTEFKRRGERKGKWLV